ncbi:MAG: hypothetical protein H7Z15_14785 [Rhizobacter sp.]|nr:hypothetical protein [Rhizobacter sp.]
MIWLSTAAPGHCTLDPTDVPNTRELNSGVSIAAKFPTDLSYRMSDRFPDDYLLSDNFNVAGQIIVSAKLRAHLETALPQQKIEYLPATIVNHKDRVAASDYFIVHSLDVVDCIDLERSKVKWNPLNKKVITSCKALALKEEVIPAATKLFRPMHWGMRTMASADLARELEAAGFTGLRFIPAAGFTGIG